jgi:hypothetical protein
MEGMRRLRLAGFRPALEPGQELEGQELEWMMEFGTKERPSGAKAHVNLSTYGTAEAVPFQNQGFFINLFSST